MEGSGSAWAAYVCALMAELEQLRVDGLLSGQVAAPPHIAATLDRLRRWAESGAQLDDAALEAVDGIAEAAYFLRSMEVCAAGWRATGMLRCSPSTEALHFHARLLQAGARQVVRRTAADATHMMDLPPS